MRITAIIEKGSDGMYSVRSEQSIEKHFFGGFGSSVAEAKWDFLESVQEAVEVTEFNGETKVEWKYDLPSFFNDFDYLNISSFARYVGINESKMRQYKNGLAFPGEKTLGRIMEASRKIGAELSSVTL